MTDEKKIQDTPNPEEATEKEVTKPQEAKVTVPVKFNKEARELSIEQAAVLAQKGLKFESIEEDYNTLKELALKENKSVPQFLKDLSTKLNDDKLQGLKEKCGGNEEIALKLLELEGGKGDSNGFEELSKEFPQFKAVEDLPQEVLDSAKLKGTLLLDEYLRFLLKQENQAKNAKISAHKAETASTGSLSSEKGAENSTAQSFLNGLWQ